MSCSRTMQNHSRTMNLSAFVIFSVRRQMIAPLPHLKPLFGLLRKLPCLSCELRLLSACPPAPVDST